MHQAGTNPQEGETEAWEGEGSPKDAALRARGFWGKRSLPPPHHQSHGGQNTKAHFGWHLRANMGAPGPRRALGCLGGGLCTALPGQCHPRSRGQGVALMLRGPGRWKRRASEGTQVGGLSRSPWGLDLGPAGHGAEGLWATAAAASPLPTALSGDT